MNKFQIGDIVDFEYFGQTFEGFDIKSIFYNDIIKETPKMCYTVRKDGMEFNEFLPESILRRHYTPIKKAKTNN
jgi:hypothetical protein